MPSVLLSQKRKLRLLVRQIISAAELFDTASSIQQFLLPGEEGMAAGTDIELLVAHGCPHFEGVAACTGNGAHLIFGMNTLFQSESSGS